MPAIPFKLPFSAQEISNRLATIPSKLGTNAIVQTWSGAEADKLVSAFGINLLSEEVDSKISKSAIQQSWSGKTENDVVSATAIEAALNNIALSLDPENIKVLLSQATDSNIFTDLEKSKLEMLDTNFKGVYEDTLDRDANLDTTGFTGKEYILLESGITNVPSFQIWSTRDTEWVTIGGTGGSSGEIKEINAVVGANIVGSYDNRDYSAAHFHVHGTNGIETQILSCSVINTTADTWIVVYGEINSATEDIFTVSADISGDNVVLVADVVPATLKMHTIKTYEF